VNQLSRRSDNMASTSTLLLMVFATLSIAVLANPVRKSVKDVMMEDLMKDEMILGDPIFINDDATQWDVDNDVKIHEISEKTVYVEKDQLPEMMTKLRDDLQQLVEIRRSKMEEEMNDGLDDDEDTPAKVETVLKPLFEAFKKKIWDRIEDNAEKLENEEEKEIYIHEKKEQVRALFKEEIEDWDKTAEEWHQIIKAVRGYGSALMKILDLDDVKNFVKDILETIREFGRESTKNKKVDMDKITGILLEAKYSVEEVENVLKPLFEAFKKKIWDRIEAIPGLDEVGKARKKKEVAMLFTKEVRDWKKAVEEWRGILKAMRKVGHLMEILDLDDTENYIKDIVKTMKKALGEKIKELFG